MMTFVGCILLSVIYTLRIIDNNVNVAIKSSCGDIR